MLITDDGPSDNAWGIDLVDPVLVSHQQRLVLVARGRDADAGTLYYRVLDPSAAAAGDDLAAWNGWYRHRFPEAEAAAVPANPAAAAAVPGQEQRLAGMGLVTVPPVAKAVRSAEAPFRVASEGTFLAVYRQSTDGTVLLNRLALLARTEDEDGTDVERYSLEPAWEVRFRHSGLRDVPLDDVDRQAYLDAVGDPFIEPTIELAHLDRVSAGAFDVARVPTAVSEVAVLYVGVATSTGVQLHQIRQSGGTLVDYTEDPVAYPPLSPTLRDGGAVLTPIPGLAPALVFYAEHDVASGPRGEQADLQRGGHLMVALPVRGDGLEAALAVYDLAVDRDGNVPVLEPDAQSLVLVDGTLADGRFTPDTTAPAYPKPDDLAETVQVVDRLVVSSMLLGQVQPTRSPTFYFGDDGLLHLYYGGPLPTPPLDPWGSLDPSLPQAMVAQFDARANRLVLSVPWHETATEEEGNGAVDFVALQSGCIMDGATVAVSDGRLGEGPVEPDLCTVEIGYPPASTLPAERWDAVPRRLEPFMDVLNGNASGDSADPAVLSGAKAFFDYSGTLPIARVPLTLPPDVDVGPTPRVTVVSTRTDLPLGSARVALVGEAHDWTFDLATAEGGSVTVNWREVPVNPGSFGDLFDGAAAPATYAYPPDATGTPLFGLATDAVGLPAPVVLYSLGTNPEIGGLTVTIASVKGAAAGTVEVTFAVGDTSVLIPDVPADVECFVRRLRGDELFLRLGLGISAATAAGKVRTTSKPVRRMALGDTAVLFDILLPAFDLTGAVVDTGSYAAGRQSHSFDPGTDIDPTRMVGFVATSLPPAAGAPAYVLNTGVEQARASLSRSLHPDGTADPLVSGVWRRQAPEWQCSFANEGGQRSATVPVLGDDGHVRPESVNLRPQWDWTLEAWVRPDVEGRRRLVTFRDAATPIPAGKPSLDYAVSLDTQQVVAAGSYAKAPGKPDSSYFQTGTSQAATFAPVGELTWEVWVKPDDQAGPSARPGSAIAPLGTIVQLQEAGREPFLRLGLTAGRQLRVVTIDDDSNDHVYPGPDDQPVVLPGGQWSHVALVGEQHATSGRWTLSLVVDAAVAATFGDVDLQHQPGAYLIVGANTVDDATLFGSLAQLRYWSYARSAADIRRTWLASMTGSEVGLLGNWPLSAIEGGGPTGKFVVNTAAVTGLDWDASLYRFEQPLDTVDDSFFLSVVASVGGLPAVEAEAMLANHRWNHLAVVFQAGGALDMNPKAAFGAGRRDWVDCGDADSVQAAGQFAIDAWLRVPTDMAGTLGTILARWDAADAPDHRSFQYWIDADGEMNFTAALVTDEPETPETITVTSTGAALRDGVTHHVAVVLSSRRVGTETKAEWTVAFYKDAGLVGTKSGTIEDVVSIEVRASQSKLTIGCAYPPIPGAEPLPDAEFSYLRARLGEVRIWNTAPTREALFPERFPRFPRRSAPPGLVARWSFREQSGRITVDSIGGAGGKLSTSAMRSTLADTSTLGFVANGAWAGRVTPTTALEPVTESQFTFGAPVVEGTGIPGLSGGIAQVSLFDQARSVETIQDQMYVPRWGEEASLVACWDFGAAGADITAGENDIVPPLPADRVSPSTAPLSNEGPYVRNVYGGLVNDHSQSTPGLIAVGSYADAQDVGTRAQRAVVKRQYVADPDHTPTRAIQVGELRLVYLGQVQTDPTLIGYIEGAPPVPSENLTRPYYLSPYHPWPTYLDTATVALVQEAAETVTFTSSSAHATEIDGSVAVGLFGIKAGTSLGFNSGPFTIYHETIDLKTVAQLVFKASGGWTSGMADRLQSTWGASQQDLIGVSGDWEPRQADLDHYLDARIGRRFLIDNYGYALVQSLTADLYATTFGPTGASLGTIVLPNPAIPPDRNVILFPLDRRYTKNGTLDGKVGLVNDPDYPEADWHRGSHFKPVEAYALAARIQRHQEQAQSVFAQFDPARKAYGWDTGLDDARAALSQDFSQTPGDPGAVATPVQGLANRYLWTTDGGFHAELQSSAASSTHSYSGGTFFGLGGGFHVESAVAVLGAAFAWSLDIMSTHRVDISLSKESADQQALHMDVKVAGDAFIRTFDPDAPAEYGGGTGAYLPGAAPGKVKRYRFMTFYLPPSTGNSRDFATVADPVWLRMSNDANARALRELDSSSPTWRVLHRVTYVERVPPPIASRPVFTPATTVVAPVNVEGNAALVRLVDAQIPPAVTERTRLVVGRAVAATLNPAPVDGEYPPSVLEQLVPWWRVFLDRARPTKGRPEPDPEAAALLRAIVSRATAYLYDGYASGAFATILDR